MLAAYYLLASTFIMFAFGQKMLGPCDFIWKTSETCEGVTNTLEFGITQKKYNRTTTVMDILIKSPNVIDNNLIVELKGSMKKEGGYKPGAFYMKDEICKVFEILVGDVIFEILQAAGVEKCPLPPGEHLAENYYFENANYNVPQLFGEYKMEVTIFNEDDSIEGCYVNYYDLVPKEEDLE